MITLYQRTDCPFCWKVRIALAELGVDYQLVETELGEKHPDIIRLSPTRTVPLFVDKETVIWESSVVLDYLDRRYEPGRIVPDDPDAAVKLRLLQVYSDKVVGSSIFTLVKEKRSKTEADWNQGVIAESESAWRECEQWLETQLTDLPFFGASFSVADCALAARFGVAEAYGVSIQNDTPRLYQWFENVKARDSWSDAYPTSFMRAE